MSQVESATALPPTAVWIGDADGHLELLDQTLLPAQVAVRKCNDAESVWDAIKVLAVRGAPAIGVAAGFGLCLGTRPARDHAPDAFRAEIARVDDYLASSRPTAVNLMWALREVRAAGEQVLDAEGARAAWSVMFDRANQILEADRASCRAIGEHGADLIRDATRVLTHCNAGALATLGVGTATAPMYVAHEQGRAFRVFADETRPLLQGGRLTALELARSGIDVTVICDGVAPSMMRRNEIDLVIVGADRIAANGDAANKIGTYSIAVAAQHHGVPFYVAAPSSTFDLSLPSGAEIPIEERDSREICAAHGIETGIDQAKYYNPAFDVTPASLIAGIITERGVIRPVTTESIAEKLR